MDTQCTALLQRLREGPVGPMEALVELGIYRLAARIYDLRTAGHTIETERVDTGSAVVARYSLIEESENANRKA